MGQLVLNNKGPDVIFLKGKAYYIYFFNAATNNITYVYDWWF